MSALDHQFIDVPVRVASVAAVGLAKLLMAVTGRPATYQVILETRRRHAPECARCMVERRTAQRRRKR